MAVADVGGLIKLSERKDLCLGGYFNYRINNVLTPGSKSISEQDGTYNGVFVSSQVKAVLPLAFGVKVGLYLKGVINLLLLTRQKKLFSLKNKWL